MASRWSAIRRAALGVCSILLIALTLLWTLWGTAEMYHEGWFGPWWQRLAYMVPIALTLIPTLLCFVRPLIGGLLLVGVGVVSLGLFHNPTVAAMAALIVAAGLLYASEGIARRRDSRESPRDTVAAVDRSLPLWRRDLRVTAVTGLSAAVFLAVSAGNLPIVLSRQDDGSRGERRIEGNGVSLVWAPEGPGWNWKQPWGGYPSWQAVALYGVPPVGLGEKPGYGKQGEDWATYRFARVADMERTNLCRYLSEDGLTLGDKPVDVWRMPTADEVVRSLVRDGENAGCAWAGEMAASVSCTVRPDKESPLWATDLSPIYYWVVEEDDERDGVFVAYNGTVNNDRKYGGNPRHSYRCVREP